MFSYFAYGLSICSDRAVPGLQSLPSLGESDVDLQLGYPWEIACHVSARFSAHFATWLDALTRVGGLSQKYSR
jgi:hypothetical protein